MVGLRQTSNDTRWISIEILCVYPNVRQFGYKRQYRLFINVWRVGWRWCFVAKSLQQTSTSDLLRQRHTCLCIFIWCRNTPAWDQHYTQLQISPLSVICLRQLNCRYIVKYCFCVICVYLHITQNILNVFTNQIACTWWCWNG